VARAKPIQRGFGFRQRGVKHCLVGAVRADAISARQVDRLN
jgi:hypothetical protein